MYIYIYTILYSFIVSLLGKFQKSAMYLAALEFFSYISIDNCPRLLDPLDSTVERERDRET